MSPINTVEVERDMEELSHETPPHLPCPKLGLEFVTLI